jgi:four helix bundle protein
MPAIKKIEDPGIWQLARTLAATVFKLTKTGGLSKDYSLKDQMSRSAGSIMDNIAEGYGIGSRLEFIQCLSITSGSADELKSQLYRCLDRDYVSQPEFDELLEKLNTAYKKINGFIKYLNSTIVKGTKLKDRSDLKKQ